MDLTIGKNYQLTRITGKVIQFTLLAFDKEKMRIEFRCFDASTGGIDPLSEAEFKSIVELK
ncbi:MAG: hypothetical protein K0S53_370 [Bacteroidetes bacterium]|jgi:hypothetical protein|nr:hypothetical protein [Bacteroidota bacterium]